MNPPHLFMVAASLALAHAAVAAPAAPALDAANPFAQPSSLPLNYPAFDKIKNEHFLPAYAAGMAEHLREIDAIGEKHGFQLAAIRSFGTEVPKAHYVRMRAINAGKVAALRLPVPANLS